MEPFSACALHFDQQLRHEWIATNGIGGYASSTMLGCNTRKYHGLLVASMLPPVRRMVMLSRVEETVYHDGWPHALACNEYPDTVHPQGHKLLRAFSHDPFPRWGYQNEGWTIEKQLRMLQGENTVVLSYTLLGAQKPVELEVRPLFAMRGFHELMYQWNGPLAPQPVSPTLYHIAATHRTPEIFFAINGKFGNDGYWYLNTIYRREQEHGYSGLEDLWAPGAARYTLKPGETAYFVCSTEPIELDRAVSESRRQYSLPETPVIDNHTNDPALEMLGRAARQFVVKTRDGGPMIHSGYHWNAPSGRDALVALPGLLLVTGRLAEAKALLEFFASQVNNGVMPSDFPTDGTAPKHRGADVSLWFIHAVREYLRYSGDIATARKLFDVIDDILHMYERGTLLGIRCDHEGLLCCGSPTTAATWMNVMVNETAFTPRAGRPVEINALWHNALRIGADLARQFHHPVRAEELNTLANRCKINFNRRFWNPDAGCCFDVVTDHGEDRAVRPNQLLAISLPYPVLDVERHAAVLSRVDDLLRTGHGIRTLARGNEYHGRYGGPVLARDRAYHNGSAFPWLLGPFVSAFMRVYGRSDPMRKRAREAIAPCLDYMRTSGCGQLPELFDGDEPHLAGGMIASARNVAEILRVYVEEILDLAPVEAVKRATAGESTAADVSTRAATH